MKKWPILLLISFLAFSCKKNSNIQSNQEQKANIKIVDYLSGTALSNTRLLLGKAEKGDPKIDWSANEELQSDAGGSIEFKFDADADIRFIKTLDQEYLAFPYELYEHGGSYPDGGGWTYESQTATFIKIEDNTHYFQLPIFRKAPSSLRIIQLGVYPVDPSSPQRVLIYARAYAPGINSSGDELSRMKILDLSIENNKRIDTTINLDLYGDLDNQISWELHNWESTLNHGEEPVQFISISGNNELTVKF